MDFVRDELKAIVSNLKKLERNYIAEMSSSPDGSLLNNYSCGKGRFYHSYYMSGVRHRHYLKPDDPMIEKLARKEYLGIAIREIKQNIELLNETIERFRSLDPSDIINASKRAYRLLPDQSFFIGKHENELWQTVRDLELLTDDLIQYRCEEHREWANRDYPKNTYPYRSLHLTSFGLRMRSRGEIAIAEVAHGMGLPFRYDQLIMLDDGSTISPDFTFEDKYYEEFYIDYCGMMDDPGYLRRHLARRDQFERNGINEWTNIRYVYSKDDSLNATEVKHILQDWVVPKL